MTVKINNFYSTFIYKNLVKNVTIARDTWQLKATRTTHM